MLRDSELCFDRLSPAARRLAVGVIVLCGLLVAGLRGPNGPAQAMGDDANVSESALKKRVSLAPPYPQPYADAPTDKISLQYAVKALVEQAGLRYDFDASLKNADAICRQWIRPNIRNQRCGAALESLLPPLGLSYEIRNGIVVLTRRDAPAGHPALKKNVSLAAPYPLPYAGAPTDKISVQYAVKSLAEQAGLRYDFDASRRNIGPTCLQFARPCIRNQQCGVALEALLTPLGVTYQVRNGSVVLTR